MSVDSGWKFASYHQGARVPCHLRPHIRQYIKRSIRVLMLECSDQGWGVRSHGPCLPKAGRLQPVIAILRCLLSTRNTSASLLILSAGRDKLSPLMKSLPRLQCWERVDYTHTHPNKARLWCECTVVIIFLLAQGWVWSYFIILLKS